MIKEKTGFRKALEVIAVVLVGSVILFTAYEVVITSL